MPGRPSHACPGGLPVPLLASDRWQIHQITELGAENDGGPNPGPT